MRRNLIGIFVSVLLLTPLASVVNASAQELCSGPHCTNGQYWPYPNNNNNGNSGGWNNGNSGNWNNGNNHGWQGNNNWRPPSNQYHNQRPQWQDRRHWENRRQWQGNQQNWQNRQQWRDRRQHQPEYRPRRNPTVPEYNRYRRTSVQQDYYNWQRKQDRRDRNEALLGGFLLGITGAIMANQ